jgi:multiple sugar transport system ATP-binding protein
MAQIKFQSVTKKFGGNTALDALSLDVADGEFFVLLGPTGAGKTTALRLISGLDMPDSGSVEIAGEDVRDRTAAERDVALVFQYYSLYPRYTVRQNLEFPLRSRTRNFSQSEIDERVDQASKTLRITHLMDRKTDRLSGGEMQRVSIGRAIVREPRAFLMDEPLSNLDAKLREALRSELKELQIRLKATFVFVTHDQVEAMSMGDKVAVLNKGRLVQAGTPWEIYNRPRDLFVAGFVGSPSMNLLNGSVSGDQCSVFDGAQRLKLPVKSDVCELTVGIRSEDVEVAPDGPVEAVIHDVENHGVEKIVTLRVNDVLVKATVSSKMQTAVDAKVRFGIDPERAHFFDPVSGLNLAASA